MAQSLVCWNCGASLEEVPRPISRHANCPSCYEVLHCCRMCRWYAPGRPQDCDHDRADPPVHKEGANFCEYFSPQRNAWASEVDERKAAARSQLDSLFDEEAGEEVDEALDETPEPDAGHGGDGDIDSEGGDDDLRRRLDDLFDD